MTDQELLATVKEMRAHQRAYFSSRSPAELEAAKRAERLVDEEFKRREKPKGRTLFDQIDEWDEPANDRQLGADRE